MKNFIKYLLIFSFIIFPNFVFAAFIPECGKYNNCGYQDLMTMVNNIISWVILISIPVSSIVFAYAGFILMTTGVADKKSQAKAMLWKVFVGMIFILSAWLLVTTITNNLLRKEFKDAVKIQGVK